MPDKKINVSVVMSVFNHPEGVRKTIQSILRQKGVELDFVIIDDGAQSEVKQILKQHNKNTKIQIIEQQNQGLTSALIRGCKLAKYDYIARIDAGDIAKAGRLKKQAQFLQQKPEIVCVTSWVEMVTEEGYSLYDIRLNKKQIQQGLASTDIEGLVGPAHFSTMFRKSAYMQVGQYRSQFYFAQDLDLWLRMQHVGGFDVIPEVLTIAEFSSSAISGRYRKQQEQLMQYAFESNQLKQQTKGDSTMLAMAQEVRPFIKAKGVKSNDREQNINGLYFIARCLSNNKDRVAIKYYIKVLQKQPLHFRSWLGMAQAYIFY